MNRFPKTLLAGFLLLCFICLPASDLMRLRERGVLRTALVESNAPPFLHKDSNGQWSGIEYEILKEACRILDIKLEIQESSYADVISLVKSGKVDVGCGLLSATPQRYVHVLFTNPYAKLHLALLVNRQALLKMRGARTTVDYIRTYSGQLHTEYGASHYLTAGRMFPLAQREIAKDMAEIEEKLVSGKLVAFLSDQIDIRELMRRHPGAHVYYTRIIFTDTTDPIAMAVPPDSPHLCAFLNSVLEQQHPLIQKKIRESE